MGGRSTGPEEPAPVRGLGMWDAALLVTGSIIGAGIFFLSGTVAAHTVSRAAFLSVWILGGLVALAGALCNGELGGMFPRGGGEYVYLREAYGPVAGFLSGWTSFLIGFPGSVATQAYAFAAAVATLSGHHGRAFELGVALSTVAALTAVNTFGLRSGKWTQNILSGVKLVVIAALLGLGLTAAPNPAAAAEPFFAPGDHASDLAVALVPVMFAYLGWNAATYVAGEIRDPQRNLGRALVLGTLVSTALYVAINLVYLRALPLAEIRSTETVAASALEHFAGPRATIALTALVAIAILSSTQATVLTGPRIYRAMAEDNIFFPSLKRLHPTTRVPVAGLITQGAIACVLLVFGGFNTLLTMTTFAITLFATLTVAAVFVLRVRRPELPRAFRVRGYPVTPALFIAANAWLMWAVLAHGATEALAGLAIVAAGLPVYAWFRRRARTVV